MLPISILKIGTKSKKLVSVSAISMPVTAVKKKVVENTGTGKDSNYLETNLV